MNKEADIYRMPNMGCLVGMAYQVLSGHLNDNLRRAVSGINPSEYLLLRALYDRDGLQQCEISSLLGKDKSMVSRCVAAMVRKGLVRSESISRKCLRVYLTQGGRDLKPEIMQVAAECQAALEDLMTDEEMEMFRNLLYKIINNQVSGN